MDSHEMIGTITREKVQVEQLICHVNLEVFEGPLDLLLYLIKKNDLNIYDIPIYRITEEYLAYIDTMETLNIDLAGEFLLMAAELTHIKSRMLLPAAPRGDMDDEGVDPRADLIKRLLEYQRYKEAAADLATRPLLNKEIFVPQRFENLPQTTEFKIEGNVYHLIEAFQKILKRVPEKGVHAVTIDRISVNQRIYQILDVIKLNETLTIEALLPENLTRYDIVITFLSLLEMSRLKMIKIYQGGTLETLYVTGVMQEVSGEEALKLLDEE